MAFVPIESAMRTWLSEQFPSARVVTETPANLATVLPCIQVGRIGGNDEQFPQFDNPTIDIDTYAGTREAARDLAEQVRILIRTTLEGQSISGALVLRARTTSAPTWSAYDNTSLRRFTATYVLRIQQRLA